MRQIFVDSRDRSSGTSTNFSMALPQTLSLPSGHQGRIDDLRLPNAIPTISVANNTIHVLMNGRYDYLTLTNGQCNTGDQLADRIRTKLLEVAGGWNVSTYATSAVQTSVTRITWGRSIRATSSAPFPSPSATERCSITRCPTASSSTFRRLLCSNYLSNSGIAITTS